MGNDSESDSLNFFRLAIAIVDILTQILRDVLSLHVPASSISRHVKKYLDTSSKNELRLQAEQYDKIYSAGQKQKKAYEDFDITLLYTLIKHLTTVQPTEKWGVNPNSSAIELGDDIERIRILKNKMFSHIPTTKISQENYEDSWAVIKDICNRRGTVYFKTLEQLESRLLSINDEARISEMKPSFEDKQEIFHSYTKTLPDEKGKTAVEEVFLHLRSESTIGDIKREVTQTMLNLTGETKMEEKQTFQNTQFEVKFYKTRLYEEALEALDSLDSKPILVLIGGPGCGKRTYARQLSRHLMKKGWKEIRSSPFHIGDIKIEPSQRQVILITNWSEVYSDEQWRRVILAFNNLFPKSSKNVKLIITARRTSYLHARNRNKEFGTFIQNAKIIDINENKYDMNDKTGILREHVRENSFDAVLTSTMEMFPLLCTELESNIKDNENPKEKYSYLLFRKYLHEMRILRDEYWSYFKILIYLTTSNSEILTDAKETTGENQCSEEEIRMTKEEMADTFLSFKDNGVSFINVEFQAALEHSLFEKDPDFFLNYMPLDYIKTFVEVNLVPTLNIKSYRNITLPFEKNKDLAQRFQVEIYKNKRYELFENKSFRDENFMSEFKRTLLDFQTLEQNFLKIHLSRKDFINIKHNRQTAAFLDISKKFILIDFVILCGLVHLIKHIQTRVNQMYRNSYSIFDHYKLQCSRSIIIAIYSRNMEMFKYVFDSIDSNFKPSCLNTRGPLLPLVEACFHGTFDMVKILIKSGASVNQSDENSVSPLLAASYEGDLELVQFLFEHSTEINHVDRDGKCALHLAAENGHTNVVIYLLSKSSEVDKVDSTNNTPLYLSAQNGHSSAVRSLLKKNAEVNRRCEKGMTPLHAAASEGHLEILHLFENADVNECDFEEKNPLHVACSRGHEEIVNHLIKMKANINKRDCSSITPLFEASIKGYANIMKVLIDAGVDINICDKDNKSPLFVASENGHINAVEILIKKGADIDECDKNGDSPLLIAIKRKHKRVAEVLMLNDAGVNVNNRSSNTPLSIASMLNEVEIVQSLLKKGAEIDSSNLEKHTPLHIAVMNGNLSTVRVLLENNPSMNPMDLEGKTPLHIACQQCEFKIVSLLVTNGANVNKLDNNEKTPLLLAIENNDFNIVQLLIENNANKELEDNTRVTPLLASVINNNFEIMKLVFSCHLVNRGSAKYGSPLSVAIENKQINCAEFLTKHGADVNEYVEGKSLLRLVSELGLVEFVKILLENGASLKNDASNPPLYVASLHGHHETVKLLLQYKADVNQCDKKEKQTPLHVAAKNGFSSVVELLCENAADVNKLNKSNQSPLYLGCLENHIKVVRILLNNKAKISNGNYPLTIAILKGNEEIVKELLEWKAEISKVITKEKESAVYLASKYGYLSIVEYLISDQNGLGMIDKCDKNENTPIHIASGSGHLHVVQCLLRHTKCLNKNNKEGDTPLHKAVRGGFEDVVACLIRANASIEIKNSVGETAIRLTKNENIINMLRTASKPGKLQAQKTPRGKQNYRPNGPKRRNVPKKK